MTLLESEVHKRLKNLLRERKGYTWPHYLTMARLVSRSLRLRSSALMQTGNDLSRYYLSYLIPALLSPDEVNLVVPTSGQSWFMDSLLPNLQTELGTNKPIFLNSQGPDGSLSIISIQFWLKEFLFKPKSVFSTKTVTLIDQADQLETHIRELLSINISAKDWLKLLETFPQEQEKINTIRSKVTHAIFAHPSNPYNCHLFDDVEYRHLAGLLLHLQTLKPLPLAWQQFQQQAQSPNQVVSSAVDRQRGSFLLRTSPLEVSSLLSKILLQQPVVLMGGFLDTHKDILTYRTSLGLGNILSVTFSPNRNREQVNLYTPKYMPLPNTPEFQGSLLQEICRLIRLMLNQKNLIVILVEDVPLKAQIATFLAAEFGSMVQLENKTTFNSGVLVAGWAFWIAHQTDFAVPELLIMATLPIPSPENPLVAAQISYYKKQRQDWFGLYLLPKALNSIQRAVMPLRESQGIVALLDSRVLLRGYGKDILKSLAPYAQTNYLDQEFLLLR